MRTDKCKWWNGLGGQSRLDFVRTLAFPLNELGAMGAYYTKERRDLICVLTGTLDP